MPSGVSQDSLASPPVTAQTAAKALRTEAVRSLHGSVLRIRMAPKACTGAAGACSLAQTRPLPRLRLPPLYVRAGRSPAGCWATHLTTPWSSALLRRASPSRWGWLLHSSSSVARPVDMGCKGAPRSLIPMLVVLAKRDAAWPCSATAGVPSVRPCPAHCRGSGHHAACNAERTAPLLGRPAQPAATLPLHYLQGAQFSNNGIDDYPGAVGVYNMGPKGKVRRRAQACVW